MRRNSPKEKKKRAGVSQKAVVTPDTQCVRCTRRNLRQIGAGHRSSTLIDVGVIVVSVWEEASRKAYVDGKAQAWRPHNAEARHNKCAVHVTTNSDREACVRIQEGWI